MLSLWGRTLTEYPCCGPTGSDEQNMHSGSTGEPDHVHERKTRHANAESVVETERTGTKRQCGIRQMSQKCKGRHSSYPCRHTPIDAFRQHMNPSIRKRPTTYVPPPGLTTLRTRGSLISLGHDYQRRLPPSPSRVAQIYQTRGRSGATGSDTITLPGICDSRL